MLITAIFASWRARYKPSTAYSRRTHLMRLCRQLEQFGAPHMPVPKMPKPEARSVTCTGREILALLEQPSPWLRLFMLLYLQAGMRFSETLRVTPSAYNKAAQTLTVVVKGGRQRTVRVTDDITRLLDSIDPAYDEPYIWALRGRKISGGGLRGAWERHRKLCGVNPLVTAHDLRRTAATIVYDKTKDLRAAQELLGHKSIATTLAYIAPLNPDDARRYADLLRFDQFKSEVKQ